MRIFLTGATGVVGCRLVPLLTAAGHQVTGVARSRLKAAALETQGATPLDVNLLDRAAVERAVRGHDVVINLATHIPPSSQAFLPWAWRENDRLRRYASKYLVDAALKAGCERFVQESVSLIYPDSGERWITEESPVEIPSYAHTVHDAEGQARRFTAATGGSGVVLRFGLFYGWDSGHTVDMIRFVARGTAPTFGRPDGFISSISTDDAAWAAVAALRVPAGIYNICDDEPVWRAEYFSSLARTLGVQPPRLPPEWVKHLAGSMGKTIARSQRVSNALFKREGSWAPRYASVRDGWPVVLRELEVHGTARSLGVKASFAV